MDLSEEISKIMDYFEYKHLPEHLQSRSRLFNELAWNILRDVKDRYQLLIALQHLLIAKDASVRSVIKK